MARARVVNQKLIDILLGNRFAAAALAHVLDGGTLMRQLQDFRRNQIIVEYKIGGLNQGGGAHGQQIRIPWPRSN